MHGYDRDAFGLQGAYGLLVHPPLEPDAPVVGKYPELQGLALPFHICLEVYARTRMLPQMRADPVVVRLPHLVVPVEPKDEILRRVFERFVPRRRKVVAPGEMVNLGTEPLAIPTVSSFDPVSTTITSSARPLIDVRSLGKFSSSSFTIMHTEREGNFFFILPSILVNGECYVDTVGFILQNDLLEPALDRVDDEG